VRRPAQARPAHAAGSFDAESRRPSRLRCSPQVRSRRYSPHFRSRGRCDPSAVQRELDRTDLGLAERRVGRGRLCDVGRARLVRHRGLLGRRSRRHGLDRHGCRLRDGRALELAGRQVGSRILVVAAYRRGRCRRGRACADGCGARGLSRGRRLSGYGGNSRGGRRRRGWNRRPRRAVRRSGRQWGRLRADAGAVDGRPRVASVGRRHRGSSRLLNCRNRRLSATAGRRRHRSDRWRGFDGRRGFGGRGASDGSRTGGCRSVYGRRRLPVGRGRLGRRCGRRLSRRDLAHGGRGFCGGLSRRRRGMVSGLRRLLGRAGGCRSRCLRRGRCLRGLGRKRRHRVGDQRRRRRHSDRRPARWKEAERVDVALRVGSDANAEVHVRLVELGRAARADAAHGRTLVDERSLEHSDRPEMDEGHGVAVGGSDADRLASAGDRTCERDRARRGGDDVGPRRVGDVDATVLSAGVGVAAERELLQHLPVSGPGPCAGARRPCERDRQSYEHQPAHRSTSVVV
jgi:hypothetical protein